MDNNNNPKFDIGFWGDRENVEVLKNIWQPTPEEQEQACSSGDKANKRCLVKGPDVEEYPKPKDFDLNQVMAKYVSKSPPSPMPEDAEPALSCKPGDCLLKKFFPPPPQPKPVEIVEPLSCKPGACLLDTFFNKQRHGGAACFYPDPPAAPAPPNDFGLTELMNKCEIATAKASGLGNSRGVGGMGCNRDDAVDFALRYGIDSGPKPSLYYRLRKGKYRKEF